jgi:hypothetical protein
MGRAGEKGARWVSGGIALEARRADEWSRTESPVPPPKGLFGHRHQSSRRYMKAICVFYERTKILNLNLDSPDSDLIQRVIGIGSRCS